MEQSRDELAAALTLPEFPRSAGYAPTWALENLMGPNALWLTEALCDRMALTPGMRVLDMGCGKAVSSVFLAREFGVQVWATDLWIPATENAERVRAAGMESQVFPVHAEAHSLPFAEGFFDAAVSMDAYHYFGTDDLYIGYFAKFLKPGGQIGIVVPGLTGEFTGGVPEHLRPYWQWDFCSFHSPDWWRNHWAKTGRVTVESADLVSEGWKHWLLWHEVCQRFGYPWGADEAEMLRQDAGRNLGFTRMTARAGGR